MKKEYKSIKQWAEENRLLDVVTKCTPKIKSNPILANFVQLGKPCLIITGIDAERERVQMEHCEFYGIRYITKDINDIESGYSFHLKGLDNE